MVLIIILGFVFVAVFFGPQLWVRHALKTHAHERDDLGGTGRELARHLLDQFNLRNVQVQVARDGNDHYDPGERVVRLSEEYYHGRSVTALAVAAHEVGHAIQHRDEYAPLMIRQRLTHSAVIAEKGAAIVSVLLSVVGFMISPKLFVLGVVALILFGLVEVIVHLVTLPVEFDASFNKALPVLFGGGFLPETDKDAAQSILRACAFTYVAGAATRILSLGRLLAILR